MKPEEQDSMILTCILSAAEDYPDRPLEPDNENLFGDDCAEGPVCAVGAGILFKTSGAPTDSGSSLKRFAEFYGVSWEYACGVSHGFEQMHDSEGEDARRGYVVGAAVRDALGIK